MLKDTSSIEAADMLPVISHVMAQKSLKTLENNLHISSEIFCWFEGILAFINANSAVCNKSVLFCGCIFAMCTTSISRWLWDKKELD